MTTDFLYEAAHADGAVKVAVQLHASKFNLPIKYGFAGLQYSDNRGYGLIPYIAVSGPNIKMGHFGWHEDKALAKVLSMQPRCNKIRN